MRDPELDALRTQVANQAASLAETVTEGFEGFHMGAGDWVVELSVPEGPSTGGGAQARQHVRLAPRRRGYSAIVVGSVDPVTSTAEIRTFDHVAMLHELRFGRPLEITGDEYDDFLRKVDVVMNLSRISVKRSPPPPELVAEQRAKKKISMPFLVTFVLVLVLAAFVVYRVMLVVHSPVK